MNVFPFMKLKWATLGGSLLVAVAGFFAMQELHGGFNEGIDFSGGLKIELIETDEFQSDTVKNILKKNEVNADVQRAREGETVVVKIEISGANEVAVEKKAEESGKALQEAGYTVSAADFIRYLLESEIPNVKPEFLSVDHVGPTIGVYLRKTAITALSIALALITVYVAFRFRLNFAVGALIASFHDVVITLAIIGLFQIPLSISIVAALLTILGYSINDTIVIFDRIRENMHSQKEAGIDRIIDISVMQSITRTVNTSLTTLIAILPVYLFGGAELSDMALVLIIGIVVGTYSSTFIASPVVSIWDGLLRRKA